MTKRLEITAYFMEGKFEIRSRLSRKVLHMENKCFSIKNREARKPLCYMLIKAFHIF